MRAAIAHLVTHSGGFHADELLSSVVLTRLFPKAEILRTRDRAWITPAEDRIIYDVGGAHDPEAGIFDHHQRGAPLRPCGSPYSSFGLIWAHFGRDYLAALEVPASDIASIHQSFDADFVLPIDMMDNGALSPAAAGPLLADLTLPMLLESLKPVFDQNSPEAETAAFHEALSIARIFVEASIRRKAAKRRANATVRQAIAAAGDSCVLELPTGMPFRSAVLDTGADHLLFVIHPRGSANGDGDWALTGIRKEEDGFAQRADLPAAWAGLTDAALEAASGIKGARFCHAARFIAVASSREAILAMADLAVAEAKAEAASAGSNA